MVPVSLTNSAACTEGENSGESVHTIVPLPPSLPSPSDEERQIGGKEDTVEEIAEPSPPSPDPEVLDLDRAMFFWTLSLIISQRKRTPWSFVMKDKEVASFDIHLLLQRGVTGVTTMRCGM